MDLVQYGGKAALMPHFSSPIAYQKGRGFGSVLRSIFRGVLPLMRKPIVRKGLKTLGKAAATALVEAGQRALQDEDPVGSFGVALKETSRKHAADLLNKARGQLGGKQGRKPIDSRRSTSIRSRRVSSRAKLSSQKRLLKRLKLQDIFSS
jgi:hypothetical protein